LGDFGLGNSECTESKIWVEVDLKIMRRGKEREVRRSEGKEID